MIAAGVGHVDAVGPGARLLRGYERELVCGRCRNVIAQVSVGLFKRPHITSARGHEITPVGGWLYYQALRQLETDRTTVVAPEFAELQRDRLASMQARHDYLRRGAGELTYDFECPDCRASYLRTLPALLSEVRAAPTGRVLLARQPQDVA